MGQGFGGLNMKPIHGDHDRLVAVGENNRRLL